MHNSLGVMQVYYNNSQSKKSRGLTTRHKNLLLVASLGVPKPPKLGCHQPVKLGVAWELIDKRHKRAADFEQALSCTDIRDIAHLKVGDVKELGKPQACRWTLG